MKRAINHELKTDPRILDGVRRGSKTFEFRRNDRGFKLGDVLRLRPWTETAGYLDAEEIHPRARQSPVDRVVTYILPEKAFGVPEGFCVLGISPLAPEHGWNGHGKYGPSLGFGEATLRIDLQGYGGGDGYGTFAVRLDDFGEIFVEDGGEVWTLRFSPSDLGWLRDQLNFWIPKPQGWHSRAGQLLSDETRAELVNLADHLTSEGAVDDAAAIRSVLALHPPPPPQIEEESLTLEATETYRRAYTEAYKPGCHAPAHEAGLQAVARWAQALASTAGAGAGDWSDLNEAMKPVLEERHRWGDPRFNYADTREVWLKLGAVRRLCAAYEALGAAPAVPASARSGAGERAWMQTYSLPRFFPLDPDPASILIEDIAHHLSQAVRYGGAGIRFLSVAEHSVHLANHCLRCADGTPDERRTLALWALLHDASEAYLHDVVRPVKRALPGYAEAEDRIMRAVCQRFGLPPEMPREIKALDNRIVIDERAQNMRPSDVVWTFGGETEPLGITLAFWSPEQAEREFLATFAAITSQSPAVPASPRSGAGEGEERDDIKCQCVSTFGPNPECGRCGGSGCHGASPPASAEHGVEIRERVETYLHQNQSRPASVQAQDIVRMVSALSQGGGAGRSENGA